MKELLCAALFALTVKIDDSGSKNIPGNCCGMRGKPLKYKPSYAKIS
jgi:hypothetical protein